MQAANMQNSVLVGVRERKIIDTGKSRYKPEPKQREMMFQLMSVPCCSGESNLLFYSSLKLTGGSLLTLWRAIYLTTHFNVTQSTVDMLINYLGTVAQPSWHKTWSTKNQNITSF